MLVDPDGVVVQITVGMAKALQVEGQSAEGVRLTDLVRGQGSSDGVAQCLNSIFEGSQKALQISVQPVSQNNPEEASTLQLEIRKLPEVASEPQLVWVGLL